MRPIHLLVTFVIIAALIGCGAGHPKLTSLAISPATATATAANHQQVVFTANGGFANNSSRTITKADGLVWSSSSQTIATIDSFGNATCQNPGVATITGNAPVDLQLTVSNGVSSTAPSISATAQLTCM